MGKGQGKIFNDKGARTLLVPNIKPQCFLYRQGFQSQVLSKKLTLKLEKECPGWKGNAQAERWKLKLDKRRWSLKVEANEGEV